MPLSRIATGTAKLFMGLLVIAGMRAQEAHLTYHRSLFAEQHAADSHTG
ncbi:MAG: hypothetical protein H0W30_06775 [Gemmatimonadaceae bacterium]|nr:hypothetical protein [Gemmatimonadaceae bacterium]MDQ3517339.1 hypothetical protein [Gemmatimonadota bacterium]